MGIITSKKKLLFVRLRWFYRYIRENFQLNHYVGSKEIHINTVTETMKEMHGLTVDLSGFQAWYLKEKKVPFKRFYLRINGSRYYIYHFIIFQDKFSGMFYYLDTIHGYGQYESPFLGLLLGFILKQYTKDHRIRKGYTYELYEYFKLPSGIHEVEKVDLYIHETGIKTTIPENYDHKLEEEIRESIFFE